MSGPWRDRWDPTSPKANSWWAKMYAAKRRATDRALLASMERELAQAEKAGRTRYAGSERDTVVDGPWNPDTAPVHQITEEERRRIARAFGRPAP